MASRPQAESWYLTKYLPIPKYQEACESNELNHQQTTIYHRVMQISAFNLKETEDTINALLDYIEMKFKVPCFRQDVNNLIRKLSCVYIHRQADQRYRYVRWLAVRTIYTIMTLLATAYQRKSCNFSKFCLSINNELVYPWDFEYISNNNALVARSQTINSVYTTNQSKEASIPIKYATQIDKIMQKGEIKYYSVGSHYTGIVVTLDAELQIISSNKYTYGCILSTEIAGQAIHVCMNGAILIDGGIQIIQLAWRKIDKARRIGASIFCMNWTLLGKVIE